MSKNLFNSIKLMRPKNNVFDLTHDVKLSFDMGVLTPIMVMECVPGDRVHISCESLIRMAPMVAPVMHRLDVSMHYFFVPNRILWPNWEKWITGEYAANPHPYIQVFAEGYDKLQDYMGIPKTPTGSGSEKVSAIPFAAYQAIYNEYYRDQNLIPEVPYQLTNGDNSLNGDLTNLRWRAWEHDYFTASLPFAQKGASVDIPLGDVQLKDDYPLANAPSFRKITNGALGASGTINNNGSTNSITSSGDTLTNLAYDPAGSLQTEPTTINDLRRAFKLQEWLERNARGGTRYIENILAHFGVKSSDKRLQRPEYICGAKSPVIISEVLNTTGESAGLPQGNMAGHGYAVNSGRQGSYYCEEHGYIIGIMTCMPKTAYQQGIPKHYLKINDPFQYYWPTFAHLGEQEVQNREIYAFQETDGDGTFGYVPRYAEYKYMPSRVAGDFKTSLDYWHLGRIFSAPPALNKQFIECIPDKRIFAVESPSVDSLYAHVLNKVIAIRPMPKFGTPMM